MKTYYAIQREIFKNRIAQPDEVVNYPTLYVTLEDAVRAARRDQDFCALHFGHTITKQSLVSIQEVEKSRGKDTTYRHEWKVIKYEVEEA